MCGHVSVLCVSAWMFLFVDNSACSSAQYKRSWCERQASLVTKIKTLKIWVRSSQKVFSQCNIKNQCTVDWLDTNWCFEGSGLFPGVLDLWGGGGKLVEYRAALLASHGFASLALDYLTPKITLETGKMMDNKYFEVNMMNPKINI